jgi:hypothetical protein
MNRVVVGIILVSILSVMTREVPAQGVPYAERTPFQKTLLVLGATASSVVYTPAKALYAAGGTLIGSTIFVFSAGQSSTAAGRVMDETTRGDWYVQPDHLTRNKDLVFKASSTARPMSRRN